MNDPFFKIIIVVTSLIVNTSLYSQSGFVTSGANHSSVDGSISYSIGQLGYTTQVSSSGNINQGLQQPYEFFTVGTKAFKPNISLSVFPNPTFDNLILKINDLSTKNLSYELIDLNGIVIGFSKILDNQTNISFKYLAASTYFLRISQENKFIHLFKIVKN